MWSASISPSTLSWLIAPPLLDFSKSRYVSSLPSLRDDTSTRAAYRLSVRSFASLMCLSISDFKLVALAHSTASSSYKLSILPRPTSKTYSSASSLLSLSLAPSLSRRTLSYSAWETQPAFPCPPMAYVPYSSRTYTSGMSIDSITSPSLGTIQSVLLLPLPIVVPHLEAPPVSPSLFI